MDKRITLTRKEESNKEREEQFMALTPSQRFDWFIRCLGSGFGATSGKEDQGNFVITKKADAVR